MFPTRLDTDPDTACRRVTAVGLFGESCPVPAPREDKPAVPGLDMSPAEWSHRYCQPTRPR